MKFMTDRKRALGMGSGRDGTRHHWQMMVSSMAMVLIAPIAVITLGLGLGGTHEEVLAYFSKPIPALLMALSLVVVVRHVTFEVLEAIEDYVHGLTGKLALVAVTGIGYGLIAVGLFALAKLAF